MSEPLDIEALRTTYLNKVFDEREFEVSAAEITQYATCCGELAPRYIDPTHADFQAPPTMAASLQPYNRLPDGFPEIAGLGMDAGRAVTVVKPIRPGVRLNSKSHMHDIYTKTGRSGRMVFFVKRMEISGPDGECLARTDTSTVIREMPGE